MADMLYMMAGRLHLQRCWFKFYELLTYGVDLYRITFVTNGTREDASKCVEKEIYIVGRKGDLTAEDPLVLGSEQAEFVSYFLEYQKRRECVEKFQLQSKACDKGLPVKATSEKQAPLGAIALDKEMVQPVVDVNDSGYLDVFCSLNKCTFLCPLTSWSTVTGISEFEILYMHKVLWNRQSVDVDNGGTEEIKSQTKQILKTKVLNKSNINKKSSASTMTKATNSKAGMESSVVKELKASEGSECRKKTEISEVPNAKHELKAVEKSSSEEEAKTNSKTTNSKTGKETGVVKESKAREGSECRKKTKTTEESDAKQELKVTGQSDSRKEVKATKESHSRKNTKITEESNAKQEWKTTEESSSKKEVTVGESKARKGTGGQEEKELSRPGSKIVRTCMTCGLQEPAPKVFKKCKRCKDEDCPDPPYYCGRDCQVLDWTARHRQQHEKNGT